MLRVVLDANVYVGAVVRPEGPPGQIVERFLRGEVFTIILSPAIVEEVFQALAYPKVRRLVRTDIDPESWFEDIVVLADMVAVGYELSRVSKDPDDDKHLSAAMEGRAGFVISGDSDFLAVKEHEGVRIVTPRTFLDLLES